MTKCLSLFRPSCLFCAQLFGMNESLSSKPASILPKNVIKKFTLKISISKNTFTTKNIKSLKNSYLWAKKISKNFTMFDFCFCSRGLIIAYLYCDQKESGEERKELIKRNRLN